jgi:hypothetical protein
VIDESATHVCAERDYCTCQTYALAPDDTCTVHGVGDWPPRCDECGRFVKRHAAVIVEIEAS